MSELPHYTTTAPGVVKVASIDFSDIRWGYGEEPTVEPRRHYGDGLGYAVKVNPQPCYGHDVAQVEDILRRVHEFAPLCNPVTITVSQMQDARGSNGWAQQHWDYYGDDQEEVVIPKGPKVETATGSTQPVTTRKRNWDGVIMLSGRTTEIHPAIARYVVPHEYAHILEDALGLIRYPHAKGDNGRQLVREWAKVRRLPEELFSLRYGTTTHHLMPGEIFANDFRHFFGAETEWWPHGEVVPALGARGTKRATAWWEKAVDELRSCYADAVRATA